MADNTATAAVVEQRLRDAGIQLTMGGEPTLVPLHPDGAEWNVSADGPTKLTYARALAGELRRRAWPGSCLIHCPGKRYDGEVNPRWALRLTTGLDGQPLVHWPQHGNTSNTIPSLPQLIEEHGATRVALLGGFCFRQPAQFTDEESVAMGHDGSEACGRNGSPTRL